MIEEHIDIQTKDGAMNTFITRPDQGGPFPVIIFLMDAPGKREELHDMARRIATVGYYVMLPNLYYRQVREFVVGPDTREIMFGYMNALSNDMICEDVGVLLEHAAAQADASDGPVGTLGYCMSGPFSFSAAAAYPERIRRPHRCMAYACVSMRRARHICALAKYRANCILRARKQTTGHRRR